MSDHMHVQPFEVLLRWILSEYESQQSIFGIHRSLFYTPRDDAPYALDDVYGRLKAAGRPVLEEGKTTCCYAKSEKSWISDPDGVVWEAFLTTGEATHYGDGFPLQAFSSNVEEAPCCLPAGAART